MILGNYARDGYVILKGALRAEQTLDPEERSAVYRNLRDALTRSVEDYRAKVRLMPKSVEIHRIFSGDAIYEAARSLGVRMPMYVSDPVAHVTADDLRIPGGYFGVAAHQDWPALQASLNGVTIWVPMHYVGIDDYPLEVVPGSHLLGLLPAVTKEHWSEVETGGMKFQPIEVQRGDALMFSAFLVHRTRTPGRGVRLAYSHRMADALDKSWRLRGYQSAQSRVIDRKVSYIPPVDEIRAAFNFAAAA